MITAHLRTETFRAPADPRDDDVVGGLIALEASRALSQDLAPWPTPGLVSPIDNGSHRDMDAAMLRASIHVLHPFFAELARAGRQRAGMNQLRAIGLGAEAGDAASHRRRQHASGRDLRLGTSVRGGRCNGATEC